MSTVKEKLLSDALYFPFQSLPPHSHPHPAYTSISFCLSSRQTRSSFSVPSYLACRFDAFPQREVHEDEDREETKCQRSLYRAKITQAMTPVHLQYLLPVSATQGTAGHGAQDKEGQLFTLIVEEYTLLTMSTDYT